MDGTENNYAMDLSGIKTLLQKMSDDQRKIFNKQDEMGEMLEGMDKTLTQLNQTVIGNPTYGQKGLVSEVSDIKDYVTNDKILKSKLTGGLVIVGIVWTFMLQYFSNFFSLKK